MPELLHESVVSEVVLGLTIAGALLLVLILVFLCCYDSNNSLDKEKLVPPAGVAVDLANIRSLVDSFHRNSLD